MTTTTPTIDDLHESIGEALPVLTPDGVALSQAIFRSVAAGTPAAVADLAATTDLAADAIESQLAEWPGIYRDDDGAIVGFWGLAIPDMGHRISFDDGGDVHVWCAYDPLFLAPMLGDATVQTKDPVSGAVISYRVGPGGVEGASDDHVVSFLIPEGRWDADVIASFCHYVLHFENRANGEAWVADHPGTFLITVDEAADLGRRHAERMTIANA